MRFRSVPEGTAPDDLVSFLHHLVQSGIDVILSVPRRTAEADDLIVELCGDG